MSLRPTASERSGRTRLIVNADDFGLSECVNRGIAAAFDAGLITSASVMACGSAFDHAVALAAERPSLDLGIHLVMDEERPVLPPEEIPSLVDSRGRFLARKQLLLGLTVSKSIDLAEADAEWEAQIRRCEDAGLRLSHFDGHGHAHVYPGLTDVAIGLALRHAISSCRLPAEPLSFWGREFELRRYCIKVLARFFSLRAGRRLRAAGIASPDLFLGLVYSGRLTGERLRHLLSRLPRDAVVEIMTHPGHFDAEELAPYEHWSYSWEAELAGLEVLGELGSDVERSSFAELARDESPLRAGDGDGV
jgi:predicted glycoside hydrolase/deacetylase ChbG (UPF0249 family)